MSARRSAKTTSSEIVYGDTGAGGVAQSAGPSDRGNRLRRIGDVRDWAIADVALARR